MTSTPTNFARKPKRNIVDISPELTDLALRVHKRLDGKDSPPPIMASLIKPQAIPNPLTPDWAASFQSNFFAKLKENTDEVKKLTELTKVATEGLAHLNTTVENIEKVQKLEVTKLKQAEAKVEKLEGKCANMEKKMNKLEEQVL